MSWVPLILCTVLLIGAALRANDERGKMAAYPAILRCWTSGARLIHAPAILPVPESRNASGQYRRPSRRFGELPRFRRTASPGFHESDAEREGRHHPAGAGH